MDARIGQVVLDTLSSIKHIGRISENDAGVFIPAYFAALSVVVFLLQVVMTTRAVRRLCGHILLSHDEDGGEISRDVQSGYSNASKSKHSKTRRSAIGGSSLFSFKILRLVGCLALVGLSMVSLAMDGSKQMDKNMNGLSYDEHTMIVLAPNTPSSVMEYMQISLSLTYVYASFLALLAVSIESRWSDIANAHLVSLLFVVWSFFAYRDFWPLATYTLRPVDLWDELLWAKLFVLTLIAILIPLVIPRQYVPLDPKDSSEDPSPEQTASLLSLFTFSFLDTLVTDAYRVPHLPAAQFPLLADFDRSRVLKRRGFKYLDPLWGAREEHLFFSLMRLFGSEFMVIAGLLVGKVLAMYASPIGINRLLSYLESGGSTAYVRPWMWVSWLFLGPVVRTVMAEWYMFFCCKVSVQAEAIFMHLVFEHALRMRMKADLSSDGAASSGSSGKKPSKSSSLTGKLNNLITVDMRNVVVGRDFMLIIVQAPLVVGLGIYFLYRILGISAIVGMVTMLLLFPLPAYIAKFTQYAQKKKMRKTDSRIQLITETINAIRMVKLFGWEGKMKERITERRDKELKWIRVSRMLNVANSTTNFLIPIVTMIATFASYTLVMKQQLTASTVFSSMAVFTMLSDQLREIFRRTPLCITGKVSLERIAEFLRGTELLDALQLPKKSNLPRSTAISHGGNMGGDVIGFSDASFVWTSDADTFDPHKRKFQLDLNGGLTFKQGGLNLIVGPSGSGKTSLLMALLGEMHFVPSGPDSWYCLPRHKGVAYAPQESWVQNETIRENVLFGTRYDEERYKKVIHQCGLERDLSLFEAGDQTEVGERGVTLSGGQKARVTLARAVYSTAEILLLDDVLAALDVHSSRWIVEKCFQGDLLQGRTVLLVTHNMDIVIPYAVYVVELEADGHISGRCPTPEEQARHEEAPAEVKEVTKPLKKLNEDNGKNPERSEGTQNGDGRLVKAEEIVVGHVSWLSIKLYIFNLGGILFWFSFIASMVLVHMSDVVRTWYLGYWATQYETHDPSEVPVSQHLAVFCAILFSGMVMYFLGSTLFIQGAVRGSRVVHERLISAILGTTLRWLDSTPAGRIIARCTQDIKSVDTTVSDRLSRVVELSISLLIYVLAIIYMSPMIVFPAVFVFVLGVWAGAIYIKAQLSVKREMSNAKSPVLSHLGAALAGLVSIRAYGAQNMFKTESLARIDKFTRSARSFYNLNRWIAFRIQMLGAIFSAVLATYLVYGSDHTPGTASDTGFSLNLAVAFSNMILSWVRVLNDFEVAGNSLERMQGYIDIEQEPKPTDKGVPPAYWPASGNISVEKLSSRYSKDEPDVLHNISFTIKSGERIGVVGRTGSGKSSLTLSLLRCIFTDGEVRYDNFSTNDINLDALRRNITIIPQVPELLSGTLRYNLDPFDEHDDATLNAALRSAGLYSLQSEDDENRITLDTQIAPGGANLSVGERQILALARAIVRKSKLLILDEATSAIDYGTDSIIQKSLRTALSKDTTCITIAHRLQTIMDADKIMVLDAGRLVEFDTPLNLLAKEESLLKSLVDDSGDRDVLYAMASADP